MKIGYARVSTKNQSLKNQIQLLRQNGVKHIYSEHYTGKTTKRPQFEEMLKHLRKNDQVILVRLDRFARNMRMALNAIYKIRIKGCTMRVLYPYPKDIIRNINGKLKTVNTNDIYMALMFAETERKSILWRTKQGRLYKKQHNPTKYHSKMGRTKRMNKYPNFYKDVYNYKKTHSASQTAKHFYNQNSGKYHGKHISVREVYSIKEMFENKHKQN